MRFGARELLFFALLVAIPAGSYLWVFKPANQQVTQKRLANQIKVEKLEKVQKALVHVNDLDQEVKKLSEGIEFFESKLPQEHEIHNVLDQVAQIAHERRLETKLFRTLKPKPMAKYSEQPIKMEVCGDFDSYYQFLLDLEKIARITKVKQMEVDKKAKKEGMIEAKMELSIFFANMPSGA